MNALSRRGLIAGVAATTGAARVAAQPAGPFLPFTVIGDWGRRGTDGQTEVAATLGRVAADTQSRFTISVGDNFYENGVAGPDDPHWRESFEAIYDAPALQKPWHLILGNHDYRGSVAAQLDHRSPRWNMPARYYDRTETLPDGTRADFFFIDTSPFVEAYRGTKVRIDGQDTGAQLAWLQSRLAASTAAWRIVVGHHPVFTATGGKFDTPELVDRLLPILQRHRVQAYLCGHVHNLQFCEVDGIAFATSGAGSLVQPVKRMRRPGFAEERHGFVAARLDRDALVLDFIDVSGATLFRSVTQRG